MIKFQSQATSDLVMLPVHAHAVLQLIGKSENGPGILETHDMPAALAVFKGLPKDADRAGKPAPHEAEAGEDEGHVPEAPPPAFIDEHVNLRKRAWPLVNMIERAMEEGKPIVWNVTI